jgi:hypothetical protein
MSIKTSIIVVSLIAMVSMGFSSAFAQYVTITDKDRYYEVIIEYQQAIQDGLTPYEIGSEYSEQVLKTGVPVEELLNAFVWEVAFIVEDLTGTPAGDTIKAVELITPQIPQQYREEIEGIASKFGGGSHDNPDDDLLSINELYFANLIPDLFHTGCSAISVYDDRSATGETMTAYLMDFLGGELLSHLHAVTTIRNGEQSIGFVWFLGMLSSSTMFNDNGVFMGHLDSKIVNAAFSAEGKRSMSFDIRSAFEQAVTLQEVAGYLSDPQKSYTFGYVLSLADANGAKILEIDQERSRAFRSHNSSLNPGVVPWEFEDAVIAVNSFVLAGNTDNHTGEPVNEERWNSYIEQLSAAGDTVTWEELKQIVSFDHGDGPGDFLEGTGDIYSQWTITIAVFRPQDFTLDVFFWPKGATEPPEDPDFISVPIVME